MSVISYRKMYWNNEHGINNCILSWFPYIRHKNVIKPKRAGINSVMLNWVLSLNLNLDW